MNKKDEANIIVDKNLCMSSYLALRYVAAPNVAWENGFAPRFPDTYKKDKLCIKSSEEIDAYFRTYVANTYSDETGILLSGGIDSAILASYLPQGAKAYSIRFDAKGAIDETIYAKKYADYYGLDFHIVAVSWDDYEKFTLPLIKHKCSGLHAVEVALYKAALTARGHNIKKLYCGNGADSTFGGMDKLLSQDWSYEAFMKRYIFIEPGDLLKDPCLIDFIFKPYVKQEGYDYISFLKEVHGIGIIQAFNNALGLAGVHALEPYEDLVLDAALDLDRIRNGEPKYMLRELFYQKYPGLPLPEKIPFARPMEVWLSGWEVPKRKEFLTEHCDFDGEQKWLIYCLDLLLDMF